LPPEPERRVERFDRAERLVHWATAALVLTLMATGAILYVPSLSVAVGRRLTVEDAHLWVGVAILVPVAAGALGPWGARLRQDLHQMGWFSSQERAWLRTAGRQGRHAIGKFNPGQKLNTSAIGGMIGVLFVTGLLLRWGNFLPVSVRTGATFVHDVFAFVLLGLIAGHVTFALAHPRALLAMLAGWVSPEWVKRHAPAWPAAQTTQPKQEEIK
jgi:formate dehydrogenase subunit gamma